MEKKIKNFILFSFIVLISIFSVILIILSTYARATQETYQIMSISFLVIAVCVFCVVAFSFLCICIIYLNRRGNAKKSGNSLYVSNFQKFGYLIRVVNLIIRRVAKFGLRFLFPIFEVLSGILKINKDLIRDFYISINNILVDDCKERFRPEEVMIILPHCTQNSECNIKITSDIGNCKRCGKCDIGQVAQISKQYNLKAIVASGGTSARLAVKNFNPKLIISVACERDLSAGIYDVSKIPVIGIVNNRPNGPCINTHFDTKVLKNTIERVLKI